MDLQHYVGFNTYSKALEQRAIPRKVMNTCCHNMTVKVTSLPLRNLLYLQPPQHICLTSSNSLLHW